MKIDVFAHVLPLPYKKAMSRLSLSSPHYIEATQSLTDLDVRFRIMDSYEGYVQVLTVAGFQKVIAEAANHSIELARIANDEMAELVSKYPDRFVGAVASLPLNDMDAALTEADRAIQKLGFTGVEIWATNLKPLDRPEYLSLYEAMCRHNLPIWIHPLRMATVPDYVAEDQSLYGINSVFGWLYETSAAMTRLVFARIFDRYPSLKLITHHCGGMVPFFGGRIKAHYDHQDVLQRQEHMRGFEKHPVDYFRMFYADTAVNGSSTALDCGYDFFGASRLLFATDMPFDSELGHASIRETIRAIDEMRIPDVDKNGIYETNARRIMRLPD